MSRSKIKGRCWTFGDDVDTDQIIPAIHLVTTDAQELGRHCMEEIKPGFADRAHPGDVIVAGENFGCGSSREHAPIAIKGAGISCVLAKSFARIFFRNAINIGLPILECPEAVDALREGDEVEIDLMAGTIRKVSDGKVFKVQPFPEFLRHIIDAGGLMKMVKELASP